MWQSGAYNRDALQKLNDEVESQKTALLGAWRSNTQMYERLGGLTNELAAQATTDRNGKDQVRTLVDQAMNAKRRR